MLERLKKIWRDPVLSKVLASGIIALVIFIYNIFQAKLQNTSLQLQFVKFWTVEIRLGYVVILLGIAGFLYFFRRKTFLYNEETLKLDQKLFLKIKDKILTEKMMLAPKKNNFSSSPFKAKLMFDFFNCRRE